MIATPILERESDPTTTPALLSRQEAAQHLGVSVMTVSRTIKRGDLAAVRISPRRIGILRADLDAYIAARRSQARAA